MNRISIVRPGTGRLVWPKILTHLRHCSKNVPKEPDIRNIGILAHIDAGKTTTTERMLFYSGKTHSLGEVHHGNTVTDFLSQERERGITICSSAVSFPWKGHKINLLDTPGHIDFTMEVEQSMGAIDGAVVILDASAGVEAQTITVWTQADQHRLPRLVFANKMDRSDANFEGSVADLRTKFGVTPVTLQWPVVGEKGLTGIIDILAMEKISFENEGRKVIRSQLTDTNLCAEISAKRNEIIDLLSGFDDELADTIIMANSFDNLDKTLLARTIRRTTLSGQIVPVLLGSAYKNMGVQPLMDAVVQYLPAPSQRNEIYDCFENEFVGKVFKVMHDRQRGPLSLVRILRGKLKKGAKVTTAKGSTENVQKLYEPLADDYREIMDGSSGDVVILGGLKNTQTGDLLVSSVSTLKAAQRKLKKTLTSQPHPPPPQTEDDADESFDLITDFFGLQPKIPDAVYFCSIEPPSISQQLPLENALRKLQREDPSLRVSYDETTMQTVLGGMGELHLDIIRSRILTEFKIEADLGPLQIAYKETLDADCSDRMTLTLAKEIAGQKQEIMLEMSLAKDQKELFRLDTSPEATQNMSLVRPRMLLVVKKGAIGALERGPKIGGQLTDTQIILHNCRIGRGTADSFVMSAAAQCVQKILLSAGCRLLEPIMSIRIVLAADRMAKVLADLTKRRATIQHVQSRGSNKIINVLAPLSELAGYSSTLRTLSSGCATMTMQPHSYAPLSQQEEILAIRISQGLE